VVVLHHLVSKVVVMQKKVQSGRAAMQGLLHLTRWQGELCYPHHLGALHPLAGRPRWLTPEPLHYYC